VAKECFLGLMYDETNPRASRHFVVAGVWQPSIQVRNRTILVQKDELVKQLFHGGPRQIPEYPDNDIEDDLKNKLHRKLLKGVFYAWIKTRLWLYGLPVFSLL
jgi:hypothetical protein